MGIPWWARMGAKLALRPLGIDYGLWRRVGLFRHGAMDDPNHAIAVFDRHFAHYNGGPGFVCLELGCGDALSSALIARTRGSARTILVDVGDFADGDPLVYDRLATALGLEECYADRNDYLRRANAIYLTHGLASLRELPDACVDFLFSNAVLEHVRRAQFADISRELSRILRPGGTATHQVDLRDHLGGGLNNLRFGDGFWERPGVAEAGFYTNRLRMDEVLSMLAQDGLRAEVLSTSHFDAPAIARRHLHGQFAGLPDEALRIAGFMVRLRRENAASVAG
ncbi:SAM-dependent methyltransferase [Desulfobaculum xiamenense]|uniref:SAM-dependent methyltransferase n=1 Tax=Desulfobaculum xiamenense TaxID=995050 RepID=A0A846QXE9_9BACT|nr:class I SAM-dependent methyltransferase [Desulfobaculum xiamenense]NJB69299.1 SAM-dependent methyltransferase [Desulfobaculum xiamenense]